MPDMQFRGIAGGESFYFSNLGNYVCFVRSKRVLTNESFLARVGEYLPADSTIWETDCFDQPCDIVAADSLSENVFYTFDSDATAAFSRAIEDFALDEGHGSFLAAFQNADQFEQHHERYWQLAATLDDVQVIATGKLARKSNGLKYCNDAKEVLGKFWLVLYEGVRNRVMFLGEQHNDANDFEEKQFTAFYTFDQKVIREARSDITALLGGTCPELRNFKRLQQLDLAAKRLNVEFAKETHRLEVAIKRLRKPGKYGAEHFIEDFDKTLQRLSDLKAHLPELISGRQRNK